MSEAEGRALWKGDTGGGGQEKDEGSRRKEEEPGPWPRRRISTHKGDSQCSEREL